jgi:hypothetical protein
MGFTLVCVCSIDYSMCDHVEMLHRDAILFLACETGNLWFKTLYL